MRSISVLLAAALAVPASAQDTAPAKESFSVTAPANPPVAEQRAYSYTRHGVTIEDPYAWLRDAEYPTIDDEDVLEHLNAENAYFETQMKPYEGLVDELFAEMRGRIKEDDSTVPQKDGDWLYWSEFEEGGEYRKWYRKPVTGGEAVLMLDENALAEGHEYFRLGAMSVSESGDLLAYSTDTDGSERYTARVKDLRTGELLPDTIPETLGSLDWVAGDTALVYGRANANWRVDNARLHRLGTKASGDVELYHEEDEGFSVAAGLSNNREWLIIATGDNETSEVRLVRADTPTAEQMLVRPREKGVEYAVDLRGEKLFVLTNDEHVNFRLATASLDRPGEWNTLIAGSDDFYLTGMDLFEGFYVTEGRLNGLDQVQLRSYDDPAAMTPIVFPEASYDAALGNNPEWDMDVLRLSYESMVTPGTVYDYHVADGRLGNAQGARDT